MSHHIGLLLALLAAGVGFLVGGLVVLSIDPFTADILTKAAFFVAFFLFLSGVAVPILFWGKVSAGNREILYAHFPVAVRQGVLLGTLFTVLLILQSFRALSWWDSLLVVAGAGFVELAFRSRT